LLAKQSLRFLAASRLGKTGKKQLGKTGKKWLRRTGKKQLRIAGKKRLGRTGKKWLGMTREEGDRNTQRSFQRESNTNGIASEFYRKPSDPDGTLLHGHRTTLKKERLNLRNHLKESPGNGFRLWKGQTQGDKTRVRATRERQENREVQVLGDYNPPFLASECKNLKVLCAGR